MSKKIIAVFFGFMFLSASVFADMLCNFAGDINFAQHIFQMQLNFQEKQRLTALLKLLSDNNYSFNVDIEHFKISEVDISTKFESTGSLLKDKNGRVKTLKGLFWSNYSLVNHKPFREMSGAFELDKDSSRLLINSFAWGDIEVNGIVDLISPFNLSLTLLINDMEMNELALILGISTDELDLKGKVFGKLKIDGFISKPQISGELKSSRGSINELKYSSAFINFKGSYPLLNITDSVLTEEEGMPLELEAKLDLRELNNFNSPRHSIKISPSGEKGFNWQSWKVSRKPMNESSDSLEFQYKLKPNRPFAINFGTDQEVLGLEHKIKF